MPTLGRWISRDPLEADVSISLYANVMNNPIVGIDPTGLYCKSGKVPPCHISFGSCRGDIIPPYSSNNCPKGNPWKEHTIRASCKLSRKCYDKDLDTMSCGGGEPWMFIAETHCCAAEKVQNCCRVRGDLHLDNSGSNGWSSWPGALQRCLVQHEQRRQKCCRDTCFNRLRGKDDHYKWLACIMKYLSDGTCYGRQALTLFPECKPPPPWNGKRCESQERF